MSTIENLTLAPDDTFSDLEKMISDITHELHRLEKLGFKAMIDHSSRSLKTVVIDITEKQHVAI